MAGNSNCCHQWYLPGFTAVPGVLSTEKSCTEMPTCKCLLGNPSLFEICHSQMYFLAVSFVVDIELHMCNFCMNGADYNCLTIPLAVQK